MTTRIVESLVWRGPTMDDIPAAVALMNTVSMAEQGVKQVDADYLRREWETPDFTPEEDTRFVYAPDGTLIAYIELWSRAPHVHQNAWGCVHPDYQGQGIGAALMDWAEARAADQVSRAPEGSRVTVQTGANAKNERAARLLVGRDYAVVRHYWRMVGDLDPNTLPELPEWPDGITIRPYIPKLDDRFIYQLMMDSFRDHWGFVEETFDEWRQWATSGANFDPNLWFLAVTTDSGGNEIVGAALCRPSLPEDPDMGWIGTLGVLREYRHKGIGSALLRYAIGDFYRQGKARVGLAVDSDSLTGATRLYEAVGMRVTRQRDRYEKVLRDGEELSTQTIEGDE